MLANASGVFDAERTAYFFNTWKDTVKKKTPKISPKTTGTSTTAETGPGFTAAEITQYYTDRSKGKYNHDPDAKMRIENEIVKAQMEGRITA